MAKPDFIVNMRKVRQSVMAYNEVTSGPVGEMLSVISPERVDGLKKENSTLMRAMNIVGAFARRAPLKSVECGDIDNTPFHIAAQAAVYFMRDFAESNINKEFDDWLIENLESNNCNIMIVEPRQRVLVL